MSFTFFICSRARFGSSQKSDTIIARQDGVRELHLQLFHNQNNMPEYYSAPIYVCISLSRLSSILRKGDEIYLKVNTYDGMQEKRFVY